VVWSEWKGCPGLRRNEEKREGAVITQPHDINSHTHCNPTSNTRDMRLVWNLGVEPFYHCRSCKQTMGDRDIDYDSYTVRACGRQLDTWLQHRNCNVAPNSPKDTNEGPMKARCMHSCYQQGAEHCLRWLALKLYCLQRSSSRHF
jgi:hypothetical protein